MTERVKPTIISYQEFMKAHTKYSRSPCFNMDRHGFSCVQEWETDIYKGDKTQRSRDAVQEYIEAIGADTFSQYVYYRTKGGWDLPYIFIFAKK